MIHHQENRGTIYLKTGMLLLLIGMLAGVAASVNYIFPGITKSTLGFISLRPLHVSSVIFWIISGATGCVYACLSELTKFKDGRWQEIQWMLWVTGIAGILLSAATGRFGGREYWESDPFWSSFILASWVIFLISFFKHASQIRKWPVYIWMWMTGIIFFLFTFMENYLWLLPYFRETVVTDMTIQWKVNGSLVGSWNQMLYGTAFYLMYKISPETTAFRSRTAFAMYFLGLFNLMFNWGHHIYTLPTQPYVRYIAYVVSMTEWIIFLKIIYNWKSSVSEARKNYHLFTYRFLMAADIWVALNLFLALLISVPAINVYTHGTWITVAHAMGTTIGINSMILLAACFYFLRPLHQTMESIPKKLDTLFWVIQCSLFVFWISLLAAGVIRADWQHQASPVPFSKMMDTTVPWFIIFTLSGISLMISTALPVIWLLRKPRLSAAVR